MYIQLYFSVIFYYFFRINITFGSLRNMSVITSMTQLKREFRPCRELVIQRKLGYTHHIFVGEVDEFGCNIYHYSCNLESAILYKPPGKITKTKLYFENRSCAEILDCDFDKEDKLLLMKRDDYPNDDEEEENCIKRAQSRVGEELYSVVNINCESYVNWVFSNDNTSKQITNSFKNQIIGNAFDGVFSTGALRLLLHLAFLENQISHNKEEKEVTKGEKKENKEKKNEEENKKAISISNVMYLRNEKENSYSHETEAKQENLLSYRHHLESIEEKLQQKIQEKNSESHKTEEQKEKLLIDIHNLEREKEALQIVQELSYKMEEEKIDLLIYMHLIKSIEEKLNENPFHRNPKKPQQTNRSINLIPNLITPMARQSDNEEEKARTHFFENKTEALHGQREKIPKRHYHRNSKKLLENDMLSNMLPNSSTPMKPPSNNEEEETQTHFEENETVALRRQPIARRPFDGENNHPILLGILFLSHSMGTLYPNNTHLSQKRIGHNGEFIVASKEVVSYGFNRNPSFLNTAVEKRMTKNLTLTSSTIFWKCFFHTLILIRQIYIVRNNDVLTPSQKFNSIAKEFFSTVCGVAGSVLVQAVLPIPFIGSLFYGMIGHAVGGIIGGVLFP